MIPLYAGTATTSLNFLQENVSARDVGMGGLFTATAKDSNSIYTNPAGLSLMDDPEINFSYAATQDFSRYGFVAYAYPIRVTGSSRLSLGTGFLYYSAGNVDINYSNGTTQSFNAETSFSETFSVSGRFNKVMAIGISPKFIHSTLVEQFTATTFALDAGVMVFPFYELLKERIVLGAGIQNLGPKVTYKIVQHELPRIDSAGFSIRFLDQEEYGSITGSAQMEKVMGEQLLRYRVGGEYALGGKVNERIFFLRGGYRINFSRENYSIGVGFQEKRLQLDYAFVNGVELEKTHRFTLLFRFGSSLREKTDSIETLGVDEKPTLLKEESAL